MHAGSIWDVKLEFSGVKNTGRGNFTSCQPKRFNSKKVIWKLNSMQNAKYGVNPSTGGQVMGWFPFIVFNLMCSL